MVSYHNWSHHIGTTSRKLHLHRRHINVIRTVSKPHPFRSIGSLIVLRRMNEFNRKLALHSKTLPHFHRESPKKSWWNVSSMPCDVCHSRMATLCSMQIKHMAKWKWTRRSINEPKMPAFRHSMPKILANGTKSKNHRKSKDSSYHRTKDLSNFACSVLRFQYY